MSTEENKILENTDDKNEPIIPDNSDLTEIIKKGLDTSDIGNILNQINQLLDSKGDSDGK